jgi:transposase
MNTKNELVQKVQD